MPNDPKLSYGVKNRKREKWNIESGSRLRLNYGGQGGLRTPRRIRLR
jgi:hypothetical protein